MNEPVRLVSEAIAFVRFAEVPTIPEDAGLWRQYHHNIPESWNGDLSALRLHSVTPGPVGHARKTFDALLGEANVPANAIDIIVASELPEKWRGKLLLLLGSRFILRSNGKEFVLTIDARGEIPKLGRLYEMDAVEELTRAIVFKED